MNFQNYSFTDITIPQNVQMKSGYNICYRKDYLKNAYIIPNILTDMAYMYYYCTNLTSSPICGPNVTNMSYTYYSCYNLIGSPVCGEKVQNMSYAYSGCNNLIGQPVCGPNVTTMTRMYSYCSNLTGQPVCGPNVFSMSGTYSGCKNLTGIPVCGNKVTDMSYTYSNCNFEIGVCGPNVTNMYHTYSGCNRLITGICGPNVSNMSNAFSECVSLSTVVCGPNLYEMDNAFVRCYNLKTLYMFSKNPPNYVWAHNTFFNVSRNLIVKVPADRVNTYKSLNPWGSFNIQAIENICILGVPEQVSIPMNKSKTIAVNYYIGDEDLEKELTVISSDEDISTVSNISITDNGMIKFNINALSEGASKIILVLKAGNYSKTKVIKVNVAEYKQTTYTVDFIEGASYGFELQSDGYYSANNKNVGTYAICRINIQSYGFDRFLLDYNCWTYTDKTQTFSIISNLNQSLSLNMNNENDPVRVFRSSYNAGLERWTLNYGVLPEGSYFIDIKFVKNRDYNGDYCKFKVLIENALEMEG